MIMRILIPNNANRAGKKIHIEIGCLADNIFADTSAMLNKRYPANAITAACP
jgi:hypothetical protein